MSDLEDSFLQKIARQPHDWLPRLIFADWLEEQGDPRGELIRLSHQLTRLDCEDRQREENRLQELAASGVVWPSPVLRNSLGMEFVLIPPGQFRLGSPPEEKDRTEDEQQVNVTLTQGFWLGRFAVTQAEWEILMGTTPWKGSTAYLKEEGNCPAIHVSWAESGEFCERLTAEGQREGWLPTGWKCDLPTETQWEYACRAGTTTRFSFGDHEARLGEYAWFDKNAWQGDEKYAHPVGQKKPNAWNLYDMHGNVMEWCWRRDSDSPGRALPDGRVWDARGGFWFSPGRNCRCASRYTIAWGFFGSEMGFRVALVPSGSR